MFKVNLRNTFGVKKMADSTSKPLHKPTVDRWSYGDGIIP